jgi:hypothetical protein
MRLLAFVSVIALGASAWFATQLRGALTIPAPTATPEVREAVRSSADRASATAGPKLDPHLFGLSLPVLVALEISGGSLGLATTMLSLGVRRARNRRSRLYGRYLLHLSSHDEAKPQDVEDMMEAIAQLIRALPVDRARNGQPHVALELEHGVGESGGFEWALAVLCPPGLAIALDGVISGAYPDARLGRIGGEPPMSTPGRASIPGFVMRFRKQRGFVYPLLPFEGEFGSPPLETIAHTQCAIGKTSTIRFTLTPAAEGLEAVAHRLFRRHENRLVRQERWGLPEGGLNSTLNRSEMANASRAQNRGLFWLELAIAADDRETCRQLAAAVQARRGENRLRRRWMVVRKNLYRRRFASGTPPLVPSPRALISAAEAAHLLALPTARMKGVPVRRIALPRIPMTPEILRASAEADLDLPASIEIAA